MNSTRIETLERCLSLLQEAYDDLEMVKDDEEEAYDNMPEGLQESERGDMMQEAIEALDEALSPLEMAIDDLETICSNADDEEASDYNPFESLKPGDKVIHKTMGQGVVKSLDEKYIVVEFSEKEMKLLFPDAFNKGYLTR